MNYMTIVNTSGTRKIKLEYGLDKRDELQHLIHERTGTQEAQRRERPGITPIKSLVRVLYFLMRLISLPLILIDKLYGARPYVTVASVTAMLTGVVWNFAPVRDNVVATVAIWLPGLLLSSFSVFGEKSSNVRGR